MFRNQAEGAGRRREGQRGDTFYDQSYATKIERREVARQEVWNAHLRAGLFPCQRRCGKWNRGKMWILCQRDKKLIFM